MIKMLGEDLSGGVGKLKHDRMVKMTAMIVAFSGSILAGLALSENVQLPGNLDRFSVLVLLIAVILAYIAIQNQSLNTLEILLGWDLKKEEGKLNVVAKFFDQVRGRVDRD